MAGTKNTTTARKPRQAKPSGKLTLKRIHKDGYWFEYRKDDHGRCLRKAYDAADAPEPCEILIMSEEQIANDTDAQQTFHH
jgi:hypothetical protein